MHSPTLAGVKKFQRCTKRALAFVTFNERCKNNKRAQLFFGHSTFRNVQWDKLWYYFDNLRDEEKE